MATTTFGVSVPTFPAVNMVSAVSEPLNLSRLSGQHDGVFSGGTAATPSRAGPSLEQIVAKVKARKQQALQDAENMVPGLDDVLVHMLKNYPLPSGPSRSGLSDSHGTSQNS